MPYLAAFTVYTSAMRILIDTDAFCKLATGGLLTESMRLLKTDISECERLAALPYMLERGTLREVYGAARCDELIPIARKMPLVKLSDAAWLHLLTPVADIDPGEAHLFAKAAETDYLLLTGDKRALRALKNITGIGELLEGRIVVLETILLELCDRLGMDEVRRRTEVLGEIDTVVRICFAGSVSDPVTCLRSYFQNLANEVSPLALWSPSSATLT